MGRKALLLSGLLTVFSTTGLIGCKSTLNKDYEVAETTIPSVTTNFKLSNKYGKISHGDIYQAISLGINSSSKMRAYQWKDSDQVYKKGRYTQTNDGKITINYANCVAHNGSCTTSVQSADYLINITENSDSYNIALTSPNILNVKTGRAIVIDIPHFASSADVIQDIQLINQSLKFELSKPHYIEFEVESNYSPEDVYSIFRRHAYAQRLKTEKDYLSFGMNFDGYDVVAKTQNYKSGSVTKVNLNVPYQLYSDGSASISVEDLNSIENKIKGKVSELFAL